ncbi:MAG: NUDIX domain-containing protein [Candidatus Moranbacteria bacterium]|nr:NUDIX domain-containing protein [Candidatus Moranbacteria bacterium]
MRKEHFKIFSAVHLFLLKDGNVLLSRRFNTGYRDGEYSVPAGHLDGGETAIVVMIREAEEEIGVILQRANLKMAHIMHTLDGRETVSFFVVAEKWAGDIVNNEPEKCSDLSWFPIDALPENTIPYIRHALECTQKGIAYSEFGWE